MSVDLRTELNDGDNVTGFASDGNTPALNTLTGQRYEGTGAIDSQHTNANEHMWTTQTSGGGGTFSLDLSDSTVYLMVKDNLVDTFANGGLQISIGDGTDDIGYNVGGNDAVGLSLSPFYNTWKLDVSQAVATPGGFNAYTGSEAALDQTAIDRVGVGTLHLAKAQGNVANIFLDRITYIANGSFGLRINGGTVGTPETMNDVQGDDATNGWGVVNQPAPGQFNFFAPTEWGEPAANADAYFTASGEQWFLIGDNAGGRPLGVGNFPFRVVGNATDTVSFVIDSVVVVGVGTRATFDFSSVNVNTLQLTGVVFTNIGAITFAPHVVTAKKLQDVTFNDCDQVYLDTMEADGLVFNGTTDALGAILLDTTAQTANQTGLAFNSDGAGHAIYITQAGTYDFVDFEFNGFGADATTDAAVYNNSGGLVTINISGGLSPTVRNGAGASTVINNQVPLSVLVLDAANLPLQNIRVAIVAEETAGTITTEDVILNALSDINGEVSILFSFEGAFGTGLQVSVRGRSSSPPATRYENVFSPQVITASGLTTTITMRLDDVADDTN